MANIKQTLPYLFFLKSSSCSW